MKSAPRKSKRKPRKSFIDEDEDENSNSNAVTDIEVKVGEGKIGGKEGHEEKLDGDAEQQGEVLPPNWKMQQEQIAGRVNWEDRRDGSQSMEPNMEERDESKTGLEELSNGLDETIKFEVAEENALNLEMSVLKDDASEEKQPMQSLMGGNKVSTGAAAFLAGVTKESNMSCGCSEPFLDDEEKCKENCANRKAGRECTCAPPCSNMAVQMLRQGKTAPLVKEEADRLVTTCSVPDKAMLGELTGEVLTKEEMSRRLEEYTEAGMYSRIWKLGPDLRLDTEPLERPGSLFR